MFDSSFDESFEGEGNLMDKLSSNSESDFDGFKLTKLL